MRVVTLQLSRTVLAVMVCASVLLLGCKSDAPSANRNTAPTAASDAKQTAAIPSTLDATDDTWTPEAMEDLMAPVALYPDKILGNVLVAATNPQEVLDAGNWRLKNDSLEGKALDEAAKQAGFTPPVRVLLQNPVVLDMMSSEFGWTEEVGQAFVNDQSGVLEAVQRLRVQAKDAGNLVTSDKMVVNTEVEDGQQAIVLSSPDPEVVYVPQYDPEAVYTPAQPVEQESSGHSTGTVVAAAALGFLGGVVLANVFNDDDDEWYDDDYYRPNYYGAPMPYYSQYPYRPAYSGYYPSNGYVRPPTYRYSYNNTTVVHRDVDNYWNRYDDRSYSKTQRASRKVDSPITRAKPNRSDVASLNDQAKRGPKRKAPGKAEREQSQTNQAQQREARARGGGQGGGADKSGDRAGKAGGNDRANAGGGADRDRAKAGGGGGAGGGNKGGGGKQGGGKQGGGNKGGGKQGGGKRPRG